MSGDNLNEAKRVAAEIMHGFGLDTTNMDFSRPVSVVDTTGNVMLVFEPKSEVIQKNMDFGGPFDMKQADAFLQEDDNDTDAAQQSAALSMKSIVSNEIFQVVRK